ncbi:MAG TPA: metal-dependent hydrolase [Myxococcaceae bacterium]|jgi:hypothetical protein
MNLVRTVRPPLASAHPLPLEAAARQTPFFERRPLEPDHVRPRRTAFSFHSVSRHWLAGNPVRTHFFNAINLFVVSFEDFMGRVMRSRLPYLEDAAFKVQVRGFIGQESTHAHVHAKYLARLREQGFEIDGYLAVSERIFSGLFEKWLGGRVSVAMIAGFEHLTALLAEVVLSGRMLQGAEPEMKAMWEWHAAEELEHKSLAFELLRRTSGSVLLRLLGAVLGALVVVGFIAAGMGLLLRQDGVLGQRRTWGDLRELLFGKNRMAARAASLFVEYFRPGFHPEQRDTTALAEEVLGAAQVETEEERGAPVAQPVRRAA